MKIWLIMHFGACVDSRYINELALFKTFINFTWIPTVYYFHIRSCKSSEQPPYHPILSDRVVLLASWTSNHHISLSEQNWVSYWCLVLPWLLLTSKTITDKYSTSICVSSWIQSMYIDANSSISKNLKFLPSLRFSTYHQVPTREELFC